jgi:hypothetical protein
VTDVLELAADGPTGLHRDVRVPSFERLDARLLVDADDVLVLRRFVVDAQHVVAFGPELVVVRRQVHLLTMRLQVGVMQDSRDRTVADLNALSPNVLAEERRRPMRDR